MSNFVVKIIFFLTKNLRSILIKIIPKKVLKSLNVKLINNSINKKLKQSIKPFNRKRYEDGVNLIGFIKGEIGLGQSCRLLAETLSFNDCFNYTIYSYEEVSSMRFNDNTWDYKITNTLPNNINIIHLNPPELAMAHILLNNSCWDYKYNIGFWLWELEEFPDEWVKYFSLVDEVWTPSNFASNSIRKKTNLPVHTIIYPIIAPIDESINRKYFELPECKFLFLCMYDSNSTMERKNPTGVIEAFKKAFSKNNNSVGLVIKVNNPQKDDIDKIKNLLIGYENIYIIQKIMSKPEVNSLIKNCDVYVSLHRAEGFGLPLAEAMFLGTPTIATNWSANTEFMNNDNACMVDYELITLEKDYVMYKRGNKWADPNIDQAAMYMKKLYEDKKYYNEISIKAQNYIKDNLNLEKASNAIQNRINSIYYEETNYMKSREI